jgi:hypothetical protein
MYLKNHQESKHGDIILYCNTCEFKAERKNICNNNQDIYEGGGHSSESVGHSSEKCWYLARRHEGLKRHLS